MRFCDKLIDLRKKNGFSQEELGEKLGVTRQTISKWELGDSTPEMDKIIELGKIFNVDIDELVCNKKIDKKSKKNFNKRENIVKVILVLLLILILSSLLFIFIYEHKDNKNKNIFSIFNNIFNSEENEIDNYDVYEFNAKFELQQGDRSGFFVKNILTDVISTNKKGDRIISVTYNDVTTSDINDILNISNGIDSRLTYNILYEYSDDKYINNVKLTRIITKYEIDEFNNQLEFLYSGSLYGSFLKNALDKVIQINNKNDHVVFVKFDGFITDKVDEIRKMKKNISDSLKYEVYYEYSEDGFITTLVVD